MLTMVVPMTLLIPGATANTHPDCSGPGLNGVAANSGDSKICAGVPTHTVARVETFDVQSDSTNLYIKRTDQATGWTFDLGFQCFRTYANALSLPPKPPSQ